MSMAQKVLHAFDEKRCKERCMASIDDFRSEGDVYDTNDGIYVYKDNGAKILAVAHLDTVRDPTRFVAALSRPTWATYESKSSKERREKHEQKYPAWKRPKGKKKPKELVYITQTVDDRLGAYILLDLLPKLDVKIDILLTEGEESGRSTSRYFNTKKNYNWMFSFDREGTDVVMYQYRNEDSLNKLRKHNLRPSWGSFSDIAFMSFMEIVGFNFGTGAHAGHSNHAYFVVEELVYQIVNFCSFFFEYRNEKMVYDVSDLAFGRSFGYSGLGWGRGQYGLWDDNDFYDYTDTAITTASSTKEIDKYFWVKCACGVWIGVVRKGNAKCWNCDKSYFHGINSNTLIAYRSNTAPSSLPIAKSHHDFADEKSQKMECFVCTGPLTPSFVAEEDSLPEKTYVCEWCDSRHSIFVIDGVEEISLINNDYTEQCDYCLDNVFIGALTEAQDDSRVCNTCLRYFKKCCNCNEWFLGSSTAGERCPQCLKDKKRGAKECKYCYKLIKGKLWVQTVNGVEYHICLPCIEKEFFCCDGCGKCYQKSVQEFLGSDALCPKCSLDKHNKRRNTQ